MKIPITLIPANMEVLRVTKKEFAIIAAAMKTYYPRENLIPNNEAMELWYKQLEDIPYKVAEACLNEWVATNRWSPSIADLREAASRILKGEAPDWGEGWKRVQRAISNFGYYRAQEAVASLDDLTRAVVDRMGFRNLCLSENQEADRANFRMIYEQLVVRKEKEDQTPKAVRDLIASIRNENKLLEG